MEYNVINYFDVWGNEEEGFEVNDSCIEKERLFISESLPESDIVQMMIELGFLGRTAVLGENIFISNTGDGMEIEGQNGFPLFGLTPVYEN